MPLFRVSLRLAHDVTWSQRRKWSNTFYIDSATPGNAAGGLIDAWRLHLRGCVRHSVFAYEVAASDLVPDTDVYETLAIAPEFQRGTIPVAGLGERYLTKACLAVALNVPSSRPSRKFWRPGLYEGDIDNGAAVGQGLVDLTYQKFTDALAYLSGALLDPDGQVFSGVGKIRLTTREFGRTAGTDVPEPPPVG